MPTAALRKCANPECRAEFKRLGSGQIYTLPVTRPQDWGLPPQSRQKVVWLCARCALSKHVEFDQEHCQVLVVSRRQAPRRTA